MSEAPRDVQTHEVDESTPLLAADDAVVGAERQVSDATTLNDQNPADDKDKPLPKLQIALLCYARAVEPIAFFGIFVYINQMVQENGSLPATDVGFYSGLIESLFSLTQMLVMIFWGKAADRLGRKPVLLFSLVGVTLATATFGMAKKIWQMVLFRCLAGVFAGTIVIIRTMIAEHSTSKTQARAFSLFAFTGNMGILLGPLIGGALADPAGQYPRLFGKVQFFLDYPYALPSFAIAFIGLTAVFTSAFFLEETLQKKPESNGAVSNDNTGESDPPKPEPLSTWELIKAPGVGLALYTYGHIMLLAFSYTAIMPLFLFTPVRIGGYGLSHFQMSLLIALNGLAQAIWILLIFPPLQHRIGTTGVLKVCAIAYPFMMATAPVGNILLRNGAVTAFWVLAPATQVVGCGVSMSFTAVQLAINDVAPTSQVLGTLNALALTGVSGIRAFSPALFTSLFAIGARNQWLSGYAIWVLMVGIAGGLTIVSRYLPDYDEMRRKREREAEERPQ